MKFPVYTTGIINTKRILKQLKPNKLLKQILLIVKQPNNLILLNLYLNKNKMSKDLNLFIGPAKITSQLNSFIRSVIICKIPSY